MTNRPDQRCRRRPRRTPRPARPASAAAAPPSPTESISLRPSCNGAIAAGSASVANAEREDHAGAKQTTSPAWDRSARRPSAAVVEQERPDERDEGMISAGMNSFLPKRSEKLHALLRRASMPSTRLPSRRNPAIAPGPAPGRRCPNRQANRRPEAHRDQTPEGRVAPALGVARGRRRCQSRRPRTPPGQDVEPSSLIMATRSQLPVEQQQPRPWITKAQIALGIAHTDSWSGSS